MVCPGGAPPHFVQPDVRCGAISRIRDGTDDLVTPILPP